MKKVCAVLLTAVLAFSFTGCTAYSYKPTDKLFTPGSYIITVKGHNGDVKVDTTLTQNRVSKIEVLEHEESPSIGDVAMQEVADQIIANQGFNVDIVSGATYSSVAILEAVSTAVKEAGANVDVITMDSLNLGAGAGSSGEDIVEGPYKAGTYAGTAKGYGGDVTVSVEMDADKIVSVTADGPSETAGIGSKAIEELPSKIVDANSVAIDGVSGATFSSNAVKEAVISAVAQAK